MPGNDIYKILIEYIQEDNRWKEQMNKTVSSIETQTKLTNGRMNKIEPIVEDLEQLRNSSEMAKKMNWKWITAILAAIQFLFTAAFYLFLDWIRKHIN